MGREENQAAKSAHYPGDGDPGLDWARYNDLVRSGLSQEQALATVREEWAIAALDRGDPVAQKWVADWSLQHLTVRGPHSQKLPNAWEARDRGRVVAFSDQVQRDNPTLRAELIARHQSRGASLHDAPSRADEDLLCYAERQTRPQPRAYRVAPLPEVHELADTYVRDEGMSREDAYCRAAEHVAQLRDRQAAAVLAADATGRVSPAPSRPAPSPSPSPPARATAEDFAHFGEYLTRRRGFTPEEARAVCERTARGTESAEEVRLFADYTGQPRDRRNAEEAARVSR